MLETEWEAVIGKCYETESKANGVTDGDKRQVTFSKLHLSLIFFFFLADDYRGLALRGIHRVLPEAVKLIEIIKH